MRKVNFLRIMSEHIYSNSVIRFMKFWETYIQVLCCVVRSLDWTFSSNYMNDLVSICLGNWSKVKLFSFSWFFNVFRSLVTWELKWDIHLPPQNPTVLITLTFINVWVFVIRIQILGQIVSITIFMNNWNNSPQPCFSNFKSNYFIWNKMQKWGFQKCLLIWQ